MSSWTKCGILALALLASVAIADVQTAQAETTAPNEQAQAETVNPIPRLAELRLDEYLVPARALNLPLPGRTKTRQEVIDQLDEWTEDQGVGGVLLDVGPVALSLPDVEEIRNAIERMRASGKKVRAFLNSTSPNGYLLACAADEIVIAPTGAVMIPGLGRLFTYMKGYYQMQGVEYDVITAGRYKYPGFLNRREPDEFFREEFGAILDSWIADYTYMIGKSRNLTAEKVQQAINTALFNATAAQQFGLVDELAHYDDYRDRLLAREKMRKMADRGDRLANVNSIQDLVQVINEEMQRAADARKDVGPKIAVLHARGPIVDLNLGPSFASQLICRDDFAKVVDELRKNKSIKAVVMHVDSPGGSGYASDVIWTHLRELDEEKPLVVSMGSVAGSGGYYIACPARRIFAQPTTITGSIGVLGVMQSARSAINRMDVEVAEMKRGARATLGAGHRELAQEDRAFIQNYMNDFYDVFIDRVATTRKMPAAEVRKVAEGRIWTGRDALKIGLIDELGGLNDAIEAARTMANIPPSAELKVVHYPRPGSLGEIFGSLSTVSVAQAVETFQQGMTAAPQLGLAEQARLFAHTLQPLCWMAVPDFYAPRRPDVIELLPQQSQAPRLDELLSLPR